MGSGKQREREANRRTILSMLETTPATVARATSLGEPLEPVPDIDFDWRPHPLDRTVMARRTYRWPIVVGAVLAGAGLLLAARYAVIVPADRATIRQAEYTTATDGFAAALERLATAPTVADPALAAEFAAATAGLRSVAESPLPWSVPLIPLGPHLPPVRAKLLEVSDAAADLSAVIAQAAAYRDAGDHILAIPLLPYSAPPELIDPAARALADMQAQSEAALASLDDDPNFAGYRTLVTEAMAALPQWIDRYLLALRRGDSQTATNLVTQLGESRADAESELGAVLAAVDADADAALAALRAGVTVIRVLSG